MKIIVRQEYGWITKALLHHTYQDAFPEMAECYNCLSKTRAICLIDDDEGWISSEGKYVRLGKDEHIWPHDSMAIALYLCTSCGEITALWNQA